MAAKIPAENEIDLEYEALSDRHKLFCDEYLKTRDKSKSAKKCGCPPKYAPQQGYEIYNKPDVLAYLTRKLRECRSTTAEVIQGVDDMRNFTMSKYFKKVEVLEIPKHTIPLSEFIAIKKGLIDEEQEFLFMAPLNEAEVLGTEQRIRRLEVEVCRLEIELSRNPGAVRIVDGTPVLVTKVVPDIAKMVKDKVPLKKVSMKKDGSIEVEGYSALDAAEKLLRLDAAYAEEDKRKAPKTILDMRKLSDSALDEILNAGSDT